jgi:hypothetical protein
MKNKIQAQIDNHVASILKKDAIDFCDYQILCSELLRMEREEATAKFEAEKEERVGKMTQMLSEVFK